ncbi:MAG: isochorismate synthase MenF [Anaerolineae bacterium]
MPTHRIRVAARPVDALSLFDARLPEALGASAGRFYYSAIDPTSGTRLSFAGVGRAGGGHRVLGTAEGAGAAASPRSGALALLVLPFDPGRTTPRDDAASTWDGVPLRDVIVPRVGLLSAHGATDLIVSGAGPRTGSMAWLARQIAAALRSEASGDAPDEPRLSAARASDATADGNGAANGTHLQPARESTVADRTATARLSAAQRDEVRLRVRRALDAISVGAASKVVVSTSLTVVTSQRPDPVSVLRRLSETEPEAAVFLYEPEPGLAFLGASPERLVSVAGRHVSSVALAGSAPRGEDRVADQALGEQLLASSKERSEHALVVDAIRAELGGLTSALDVPDGPRLKKLRSIQHLETPVSGVLAEPRTVLELALRLHPTPALAGEPRDAAMRLIRGIEAAGRGLYGGVIGWTDDRGDGDTSVAIRCVLVRGRAVTAFAGAGIVADSDPEAEVDEIELKLQAALAAI